MILPINNGNFVFQEHYNDLEKYTTSFEPGEGIDFHIYRPTEYIITVINLLEF